MSRTRTNRADPANPERRGVFRHVACVRAMKYLWLSFLVYLCGCMSSQTPQRLMAPPIPETTTSHYAVDFSTSTPPQLLKLTWDYPYEGSNIVFNVYSTTNLSIPKNQWKLQQTVIQTWATFPPVEEQEFFIVTASNVQTHLESLR